MKYNGKAGAVVEVEGVGVVEEGMEVPYHADAARSGLFEIDPSEIPVPEPVELIVVTSSEDDDE